MDDADALLAAIDADPADDLPRLVYADFLDDAGHPAPAEFIRVSCRLADSPAHAPGELRQLRRRREDVFRRFAAEYAPAFVDTGILSTSFDRGLLREPLVLSADVLVRAAPHWWPALPVRAVAVPRVRGKNVPALAGCPHLSHLTTLALGFAGCEGGRFHTPLAVPDAGLRWLAGCDRLTRLRRLEVAAARCRRPTLAALAEAPWAADLPAERFRFALCVNTNNPLDARPLAAQPGWSAADVLRAALARHGSRLPNG